MHASANAAFAHVLPVSESAAAADVEPSETWQVLLRGGWSVVAHVRGAANHALVTSPLRSSSIGEVLTADELRLAIGRARGAQIKALAVDSDLVTTARALSRAIRKLDVRSAAELVALFGPGSAETTWAPPSEGVCSTVAIPDGLTIHVLRDRGHLVIGYPPPSWSLPACLTAAEQRVVRGLVEGASQAAIAQAGRVSPRTVANQIASAYRKMRVNSRIELFVALRSFSRGAIPTR